MAIAALVSWIVTAALGFTMLGLWLSKGGMRAAQSDATIPTRLVPPLIFSHFLLAAAGLIVWIVYVIIDNESLIWIAFGLLVIVAILGETMFLRWRHSRREATPEARFPVPVVYAHGLFALITVVLVLLTALAIGGS
jgi:energy-converting hydrogenase Eha subunit A